MIEKESAASLAEEGIFDIGCTVIEADGVVRRTREEIAKAIRAMPDAPCPGCKGLANELADIAAVLRTGSSGNTLLGKEVSRWIDTAHAAEQELADLRAERDALRTQLRKCIIEIEEHDDLRARLDKLADRWDTESVAEYKQCASELEALLAETEAK